MKKAEVLLAYQRLTKAFERLKEAIEKATDDLDRDGTIQRFEFTFELLWKFLKIYLEHNGVDCFSPMDCIKKAFKHGLIKDDEIILDMLEDRNLSSHVYSEAMAKEIFNRIKNAYIPALEAIIKEASPI